MQPPQPSSTFDVCFYMSVDPQYPDPQYLGPLISNPDAGNLGAEDASKTPEHADLCLCLQAQRCVGLRLLRVERRSQTATDDAQNHPK